MYHCTKLKISDLNPHIMCVLCGGYFIDATTIIECLHSFCRTCIVRYLESSKFCPICDVQVHKTRPLLNIRSDKTLQDLVYKLVPGLFQEEMRRRREFLSQHPEVRTAGMDLEQRGLAHLVPAHSLPEERISLVLELATPGSSLGHELQKHSACSKKYLLCPSDVSMGHLKKFLRIKFALSEKYQIDVFYRQSEETISDDFTLLDVTFIYSWNRKKPLRLLYSIYEKPRRKRKLATARFHNSRTCQTKKARLEKEAKVGASSTPLLHSSSAAPALPSRHSLVSSGPKATANGLPAAKRNKFSGALSQNRTKKKVLKAKAALKSHPVGGKIKLKPKSRLSFDRGGKGGRGRRKVKATKRVPDQGRVPRESHNPTPGSGPVSSRHSAKPNGNARSGTKLPASNAQPDTKLSSTASPGFRKSSDAIAHGAKPAPPNRNGSATSTSPTLHASFYRKVASTTTTTLLNGRAKPWAKTAQLKQSKSRSSSPKLSTPGSSRSASPKLLGVVSRGSRCSSPRPATGKDSPRPSSRGSSRTGSPRPADLQRARPGNGAVPPSLPVEEKISVDVTMAASSSETSSDVTSPGAEDRANSTGLEEPGDFDGGGHVCNLAAFAPRPLPSLAQLPGSGAGQSKAAGKGSQTRESAKTAKPSQTLTRADSRTPNNNNKKR